MNEIMEYESYLRNVKNLSEKTIKIYSSDLGLFFSVMGFSDGIKECTLLEVERLYIANLVASGDCASTRARKLSSIKSFYRWAIRYGIVKNNPVEFIDLPKIPHKEAKVMSREEMIEFISAAKTDSGKEAFRNLAIILLMSTSGLRREEVTEIMLEDVNLEESSLIVHGKGKKERIVYFNSETKAVLSEYIYSHRNIMKTAKESPYLFVTAKDIKMCVSTVNRVVNKCLEEAGVKDKGYTSHSQRKWFATSVYEATGDILAVQNLLGHSSPVTTQRYVGVNEARKRMAAMTVSI